MTTLTALVCASHSPLLHCYAKKPKDLDALRATMRRTAQWIHAFDPELVIAFGPDHFNGFFLKTMPAFCIGSAAEATADIGGYPGKLNVPEESALAMVDYLRTHDIDPAVSFQMTVDHGFSQTIHDLLGGLDITPVVPVFINCITAPFVPFKRSRLLGEALGDYVASLDKRVLFLGSGGMSHHPARYYPAPGEGAEAVSAWQISGGDDPRSLTAKQWLERLRVMHIEGADMIAKGMRTSKDMRINPAADQRFLDVITAGNLEDYDAWDQYELIAEAGIGSMELHTWIAAAAAHKQAGGAPPTTEIYTAAPEIGIAAGVLRGGNGPIKRSDGSY